MKKTRSKTSISSSSEDYENELSSDSKEKDCDSDYELEMEQSQRKIIELRMIDMIKYWNEMYRTPLKKEPPKIQFKSANSKARAKPQSSIKFTREHFNKKWSEGNWNPVRMMELPRRKGVKVKKNL